MSREKGVGVPFTRYPFGFQASNKVSAVSPDNRVYGTAKAMLCCSQEGPACSWDSYLKLAGKFLRSELGVTCLGCHRGNLRDLYR